MKFLYKYPQGEYPYAQLREENQNRSRDVTEFELMDTELFDEDRYWDIFVEVSLILWSQRVENWTDGQYAKDEEDADAMSIRITAYNRGPDPADLHIIPQLFFRNTWSWPKELPKNMPTVRQESDGVIIAQEEKFGTTRLYCTPSPAPAAPAKGGVVLVDGPSIVPDLIFCDNETNYEVRDFAFYWEIADYLAIVQRQEQNPLRQGCFPRPHYPLAPTQGARTRTKLVWCSADEKVERPRFAFDFNQITSTPRREYPRRRRSRCRRGD